MAAGEIYVQLSVTYAEDPKLAMLARWPEDARAARDLYVQMICYSKLNMTDGFVPEEMIGKLAYPDALDVAERQVQLLDKIGVIEKIDGSWRVVAFLQRNKSRADIEDGSAQRRREGSEAGQWGNHIRWHVNGGKPDPSCRSCKPHSGVAGRPAIDPDRVAPIAPTRLRPIAPNRTQTETETETTPAATQAPLRATDELFDAVAESCNITAPFTKTARSQIAGVVKELRAIEATSAMVGIKARAFHTRYPKITLTPSALAKHWPALPDTCATLTSSNWEKN